MYLDRTATAFILPPKFEIKKISKIPVNIKTDSFVFNPDGSYASCGLGKCLVVSGKEIFFAPRTELGNYNQPQYKLKFPNSNNPGITRVSASFLTSRWIIGVVFKGIEGRYHGLVYLFDGKGFSDVALDPNLLISKYDGWLGFGGSDDEFLVDFNAADGGAYVIRSGKVDENLSGFFNARLHDGSFMPAVIKSGGSWYIFSGSPDRPKLLKLFSNGTFKVKGIVDLTGLVFEKVKNAVFYPSSEPGKLFARLTTQAGDEVFWQFQDRGFDNSKKMVVVSQNLDSYDKPLIKAAVAEASVSLNGAKVKFEISADGKKWREVNVGQTVEFNKGNRLFWRAEFTPNINNLTSPFFSKIKLSYEVEGK